MEARRRNRSTAAGVRRELGLGEESASDLRASGSRQTKLTDDWINRQRYIVRSERYNCTKLIV